MGGDSGGGSRQQQYSCLTFVANIAIFLNTFTQSILRYFQLFEVSDHRG